MATLFAREMRTVWRRRLFTVAIAALVALAVLLAVASPILAEIWQPGSLGALVVAVEFALLIAGLVWLALFVLSKRRSPGEQNIDRIADQSRQR